MNLLSNLIEEYKSEQERRTKEREAKRAAEEAKCEMLKREGLHQISHKGPLTGFEMAEMLTGSDTYITGSGYQYEVSVDCANGFVLRISYHENPQRPAEPGAWGQPRIYECAPDGGTINEEWFVNRETVRDYIGSRLEKWGGA